MTSQAAHLVERLVAQFGADGARAELDRILDGLPIVDAAALAYDWKFWGREKQQAPVGDWDSFGALAGRGWGKTLSMTSVLNEIIEASPEPLLIGLAAQDEASSVAIQVEGKSGLIATAPPWNKPIFERSRLELVYPNGTRAYVRTPESPRKIRGLEYHYSLLSELQSWNDNQAAEAYSNFLISTRLEPARILWDATARKRHAILLERLQLSEADPVRHVIRRGTTYENPFLAKSYAAMVEAQFGGTQRGREELLGEMLTDDENAIVRQAWIDDNRRHAPVRYTRVAIGIDPAVTQRRGNDRTGIVVVGLGNDGQCYVAADYSGKHSPARWAALVLDAYENAAADLIVVETNKAGDLVVHALRAAASERGADVVVISKTDKAPSHRRGLITVREIYARGAKEDRAQPLAVAYEKGRISHVRGAQLRELEDQLTTWEPKPGARSPDSLDALVHAAGELLGLASASGGNPSADIAAAVAIGRDLARPSLETVRSRVGSMNILEHFEASPRRGI